MRCGWTMIPRCCWQSSFTLFWPSGRVRTASQVNTTAAEYAVTTTAPYLSFSPAVRVKVGNKVSFISILVSLGEWWERWFMVKRIEWLILPDCFFASITCLFAMHLVWKMTLAWHLNRGVRISFQSFSSVKMWVFRWQKHHVSYWVSHLYQHLFTRNWRNNWFPGTIFS